MKVFLSRKYVDCVYGYRLSNQGQCKQCPQGTFTSEQGTKSGSDCIPVCGYGTYGPSGLVPCLECPQDSFSGPPPVDGFKQCTTCPEGTFTFQPGAQSVNQCRAKCEPGTYSDTGLAPCAPCPQNFFQPLEGTFIFAAFPHIYLKAQQKTLGFLDIWIFLFYP